MKVPTHRELLERVDREVRAGSVTMTPRLSALIRKRLDDDSVGDLRTVVQEYWRAAEELVRRSRVLAIDKKQTNQGDPEL